MTTSDSELYHKPTLKVLNKGQIEQIHLAAMEVLERTGIRITHRQALEVLDGAGASVNGNRMRIPSQLVEQAIQTSPARFV
jgi:trimethylamine--corrinoid protein Co-methyltransferase